MASTPDRLRFAARRAVVGALFLALFGTIVAAAPAAATADGSLTVHARLCPADYAGNDFNGVCHDEPLPGATFRIFEAGTADPGVSAVTDADGNVTLPLSADILPGPFAILYDVPLGPNFFRVYCSRPDGSAVPFEISAGSGAINIPDARGEGIVCDVYFIPVGQGGPTPTVVAESGSLTIYKSTCPAGYQGDDYFADCYPNATAGVTFSLALQGGDSGPPQISTTGAEGFAAFEGLDGRYFLFEDVPGEFATFAAYCSDDGVAVPVTVSQDGSGILLDIDASQDLRCDYYNIPFDLRGETPTAAPTVAPTVAPPAQTAAPAATAVPVTTLPSTGTQPATTDNALGGLGLAGTMILAAGAMAIVAVRRRPAR